MEKLKKGYKHTDIGIIPEDWEIKSLGEIGEPLIGLTYSPNNVCDDGILVLRSSNVKNNKIVYGDNVYVNSIIKNEIITQKGDILICVRNGSKSLIGKAALIENLGIGETFGAFMSVFRTKNYNYVFQTFLSEIVKKQIEAHLGATINQITNKSLNSFEIPLPPTTIEQTAIATALSNVDALIVVLDKKITKKQQIKQGAMQQLLTGKKRLSGFIGDWVEKTIGQSLTIKHGKNQKDIEDSSGRYPILGTGGIMSFTNIPLYSKQSVLIGRKGTIDKPQFFDTPFWTVDTLFYSEIKDGYSAKFIFYKFNQIDWYAYNEASGVPSLNAKVIESIIIAFPPTLAEQIAIAQILTDMDDEITQLEAERDKYKQIKAGMMQQLLTGKIRLIDIN